MRTRHQLRAVEGPLSGAVYVLGHRATLGRSGDSDIQIVHDGVSRQHAKVVEEDSGHILIDLSSNNGTLVDGHRIVRHRLREGDEFTILRARFRFEKVEAPPPQSDDDTSPVYAVKVVSAETLRRTVDHWSLDLPAPARRDTATDWSVPPELAPRRKPNPQNIVVEPGARRHAVLATNHDGKNYEGDIIADILLYRALRLRATRNEDFDAYESRRFAELEHRFMQSAVDPDAIARKRQFQRFECRFPARLRFGGEYGDQTTTVRVLDFGAGGARLEVGTDEIDVSDLAWLVIDLVVRGRSRTVVFTARVVRSERRQLGLIFAGAPEWETWAPRR